jgi:tetratricopeptide (TPR) repeat protein
VLTIEKEQPSEAARLFDVAVIRMVDSERYRARAYIALPLMIQEWRLEAAVSAKDHETAVESLQRILELDPLDISFSEEQLPLMRMAGMEQLADNALDQIVDAGLEHAERFSHDAMTCNNVAWVAAKNHRRLDDALDLATLAVRAEPESTTYRDTLAEILFLLGRKEEALQIEQACLLDAPGEWHLHQQITKFENGILQKQR